MEKSNGVLHISGEATAAVSAYYYNEESKNLYFPIPEYLHEGDSIILEAFVQGTYSGYAMANFRFANSKTGTEKFTINLDLNKSNVKTTITIPNDVDSYMCCIVIAAKSGLIHDCNVFCVLRSNCELYEFNNGQVTIDKRCDVISSFPMPIDKVITKISLKEYIDMNAHNNSIDVKASAYKNISEMKNDTSLSIGDYCSTSGYYTQGDGGHGIYIISNHVDNDEGLTVGLVNGLTAILLPLDDTINAKQYGIKMDGETDDTIRLQKFLSLLRGYSYRLHFGKGNTNGRIVLSNTISVSGYPGDFKNEIDFDGIGIKYIGENTKPIFHFYSMKDVIVKGLYILYSSTNGNYIRITDSQRLELSHWNATGTCLKIGGTEPNYTEESNGSIYYISANYCNIRQLTLDIIPDTGTMSGIYFYNSIIAPRYNDDYCISCINNVGQASFINCDISYANIAKMYLKGIHGNGSGTVLLQNCYFDSHEPITENDNHSKWIINVVGCFNAQNTAFNDYISVDDYSRGITIGSNGRDTNNLNLYPINCFKNAYWINFHIENSLPNGISEAVKCNFEFIEDNSSVSGKILRVHFHPEKNASATFLTENLDVMMRGSYSFGARIIKRSGNGIIQIRGKFGDYEYGDRFVNLSSLNDNDEYIVAVSTGHNISISPNLNNKIGFTVDGNEEVIIDFIEIGFNYGMTWMPGLPTSINTLISNNNKLFILSPNGTKYHLVVNDDGTLTTELL